MLGLRFCMPDSVQVQKELVGVRVGAPTILGAAVNRDAKDIHSVFVVEGQDLSFKKVGCHKGGPVSIVLGEADVCMGVYAVC